MIFDPLRSPRPVPLLVALSTALLPTLLACGGSETNKPLKPNDGSVADRTTTDAGREAGPDASLDVSLDRNAPDTGLDVSQDQNLPPCPVPPDASFTAKLRANADDYLTIWFNGQFVAAPTSLWPTPKEFDVQVFLYPGKRNVIAVEARNAWEQNGYDRGAIIELEYTVGDSARFVNSDATWKVSPLPDGGTTLDAGEGWTALDFDDSSWQNAISLGKAGIPPWTVAFNGNAEWIWSYKPDQAASEKPQEETILLRKVFYMDESGVASSEPGRCR
jgi:hypothetical protein